MSRCFLIIRVSTASQEKGYSLESQRKDLPLLARKYNLDFDDDDIYDEGVASTSNQSERIVFYRAIDNIRSGKYDNGYMVIREIDRFLRSTNLGLELLAIIREHNIGIITPNEVINPQNLGDLILSIVKFYGAEEEKRKRHSEQARSFKEARDSGLHIFNCSNPPDGYLWDKNNKCYIQDPERIPTILDILTHPQYSNKEIIAVFHPKNKLGKPFVYADIGVRRRKIFYTGMMFNSRKELIKSRNIVPYITYEQYLANHYAAINRSNRFAPNKLKYPVLMVLPFLYCGFCGKRIYMQRCKVGAKSIRRPGWHRKTEYIGIYCYGKSVLHICTQFFGQSYFNIESKFLAVFESQFLDPQKQNIAFEKIKESLNRISQSNNLQDKLDDLVAKRNNLINAIESGTDPQLINPRLKSVQKHIESLQSQLFVESARINTANISFEKLRQSINNFKTYPIERQQPILRMLLSHITYLNDKMIIHWLNDKPQSVSITAPIRFKSKIYKT